MTKIHQLYLPMGDLEEKINIPESIRKEIVKATAVLLLHLFESLKEEEGDND